jgi:protein phosphatase
VTDPEIGAFSANFHPKDACRYLIALANLRGGPDNITSLILRVGPWVEPDTAHDIPVEPAARPPANGRLGKGLKSAITGLFSGRSRTTGPEVVEDHPYRTAECPIDAELIEKVSDLTRRVQAYAVENAWSLDWTQIAQYRREEADAKAAGNPRKEFRAVGEMLAMLGQAARFHRKAGGPANVT